MYQKQEGLAMNREKLANIHVIENKIVIASSAARVMNEKGGKKPKASAIMLLKTHVEKMSLLSLAIMFMKINGLNNASHDVCENKGSYRFKALGGQC